MAYDLDQEMEKLAQLVALRAHRKVGKPRNLRLVGGKSEPAVESVGATEPPCLPDWTTAQPIDVSPRAKKMHSIMAIANSYNWRIAITHFLMLKGVPCLSDLTDPQLDDLHDRMLGYVDAAETGCSLDGYLPAY